MNVPSRTATVVVAFLLVASAVLAPALLAQRSSLSTAAPTGLIAGRVVDLDTDEPIGRAIVGIYRTAGGEVFEQVRSTPSGEFVFRHVPAGRWSVGAVRPDYQGSGSAQSRVAVTLTGGQIVSGVQIPLRRFAVISGAVVDETLEPVVGFPVRTFRRTAGGQWSPAGTASTDDRGVYQLSSVLPGEYIVVVASVQTTVPASFLQHPGARDAVPEQIASAVKGTGTAMRVGDQLQVLGATPRPIRQLPTGARVAYATQLYPGAASLREAQTLVIRPGEERLGIDFHLRPTVVFGVSGTVSFDGQLAAFVNVRAMSPALSGIRGELPVATTYSDGVGRFAFPCLPPGDYVLQVNHRPRPRSTGTIQAGEITTSSETRAVTFASGAVPAAPSTDLIWASVPIAVQASDVFGTEIALQRGLHISGRIEFDGTGPRPPAADVQRMNIQVHGAETGRLYSARPDSEGRFRTPALPPAAYILRVTSSGAWRLRSATADTSADFADAPLLVNADTDDVVVTMTDRPGSLSGTVRDERNQPAANVTVVMFPADRATWIGFPASRRLRSVRVSAGAYTISDVPEGDYYVAALHAHQADGWDDPASLKALAATAVRVTAVEGVPRTQNLRLMPGSAPGRHPFAELHTPPADREPEAHGPYAIDRPPQQGAISGRVVTDDEVQRPLRDASVVLQSIDRVPIRTAVTDANGRFHFAQLPAGRFRLVASKPAYLGGEHGARRPGRPGVSLAVDDGDRIEVTMRLARGAVVTGTVYDESGWPVPFVRVRALLFRVVEGAPTAAVAAGAQPPEALTDAKGRFRIYNLAPGEYVVGASAGTGGTGAPARSIGQDEVNAVRAELARTAGQVRPASTESRSPPPTVYGSTFHPSSPIITGAARIRLAPGEERDGINVHLTPMPSAGIYGTVRTLDSRPAAGAFVTIVPATTYVPTSGPHMVSPSVLVSMGGITNARTNADGRFSVLALTPGAYTLIARDAASQHWTITQVEVNGEDIGDLIVNLQPGAQVAGRVVPPPSLLLPREVRIRLAGTPGGGIAVSPPPAIVDDEGRFAFGSVPPGEYRLQVAGLPPGWAATQALSDGRDLLDVPLAIGSDRNVEDLTVSLTNRPGEITGTFSDAAGRAAADYYVILFPVERTYWTAGSRRIQAVRPAADGQFAFTALPPGTYRLAAVFDVEPDEWFEASFLEALSPASLEIPLGDGERKVQDIKVAGTGGGCP